MQLEKVLKDNFENCVVWPSKYNDQILKNYIILVLFKIIEVKPGAFQIPPETD